MEYSSTHIANAVEQLSSLPTVGKKTALKLALHLLSSDEADVERFAESLMTMRRNVKECARCYNLSDETICQICNDARRDQSRICVVEGVRDVMAIESTGQYRGLYHVLGGVISPLDGIGPNELSIDQLTKRVHDGSVSELIMAVSPTIEGDSTIFYINKLLSDTNIIVSSIARGVSFGNELQYADAMTLGRSIATRTPYDRTT